ncbi:MAG: translation initiation factor IF-2 [candidate division WWE3 bacterium]|nr:translation initiation factor IF-2 [candidate division WWE3 bacterium]
MTSKKPLEKNLQQFKPPVVTIMGHVDHGKTSLLDAIRKTNVVDSEFGGITQHTAAYQITYKDKKLTFIDTPGHAAFSEMRSRGGKVADIIILVVAASESVQPQTIEAISHAKAAGVPIIVALNKIDLPGARENLNKVTQDLSSSGIQLESWGGDVVSVPVSAKTGEGLPELLDLILLVAEMAELPFKPEAPLNASVIESRLDPRKGPLASIIVREGTLKVSDKVYLGEKEEKVRALLDDHGQNLTEVKPGDPAVILGLSTLPALGAVITSVAVAAPVISNKPQPVVTTQDGILMLNLLLKSDTQGTLEAILGSFKKLEKEDRCIVILHSGIGPINDSDLQMARAGNALIVTFNVKTTDDTIRQSADLHVSVKNYTIIYEMLEDIEKILSGLAIVDTDMARGRAEVIALFPLPSGDVIAGSKVTKGRLKVGEKVKITRGDVPEAIYNGRIKSLKEGKTEASIITAGKECGILLHPQFSDLKKGDLLEIV